jgi:hypothetical protein
LLLIKLVTAPPPPIVIIFPERATGINKKVQATPNKVKIMLNFLTASFYKSIFKECLP